MNWLHKIIIKVFPSLFLIALNGCNSFCQQKENSEKDRPYMPFTFCFYNVENLFDTINDPNINDEDFLPEGKNHWDTYKYNEKIKHINEVIDLMYEPLLIGLAEIENEKVVRDVINYSVNNKNKFGLVHFDSPDERGIDVALIYDSIKLKLLSSGRLRFDIKKEDGSIDKTRDILWAEFCVGKEKFYAIVNHWPSRSGGQEASDNSRVYAAEQARKFIDEISKKDKKVNIVFMGDLNDYPENNAPKLIAEKLTPMIAKENGKFGGTYSYKGVYDVLDHIMVSPNFFNSKALHVVSGSGEILSSEELLEEYKGDIVPFRTYAGSKYLGGYSDHFPVYIEVSF